MFQLLFKDNDNHVPWYVMYIVYQLYTSLHCKYIFVISWQFEFVFYWILVKTIWYKVVNVNILWKMYLHVFFVFSISYNRFDVDICNELDCKIDFI